MDLDTSLVDYMKKRAELAKLFACALSVQCFVLAVFFCAYGLYYNQFAYSKSEDKLRYVIFGCVIVISILLVVFNVFSSIRYKKLMEGRPDYISLRQSGDVVNEAYIIARPILVFKITVATLVILTSGLVYIIVQIALDRSQMAGIYGKIIVCLFLGIGILIGFPSLDRIYSYRCVLNEVHSFMEDKVRVYTTLIGFSIVTPLSICTWYIFRFYTDKSDIAWIAFPMMALFGLAAVYLINWVRDDNRSDSV